MRTAGKPTSTLPKPMHRTTQHSHSSIRILRVRQLLIISNRHLHDRTKSTSLFAINKGGVLSLALGSSRVRHSLCSHKNVKKKRNANGSVRHTQTPSQTQGTLLLIVTCYHNSLIALGANLHLRVLASSRLCHRCRELLGRYTKTIVVAEKEHTLALTLGVGAGLDPLAPTGTLPHRL
jgi:hypothetical protein